MLRVLIARLVIGAVAVCACGGAAGIGLANYVESGSFHFYKQPRMTDWPEAASAAAPEMLSFSEAVFEPGRAAAEASR
jgi:hypothetical protein